MAEEGVNDEDLTNWLVISAHVEGYAFSAVTRESEALEPQNLNEAKGRADWLL